MHVDVGVILDALNDKYEVRRYGRGMSARELSLPAFYERGSALVAGKVYVARTYDLPASPDVECLFVCIGNNPTNIWSSWRGEALYIADSGVDIMTIFNEVLHIFEVIVDWECKMQTLIENNADVEEMLKVSIPVFDNRITITDYELRVIAYCESVEVSDRKEIRMCKTYERVPNEKSILFERVHHGHMRRREPYVYTEYGIDQYCIKPLA